MYFLRRLPGACCAVVVLLVSGCRPAARTPHTAPRVAAAQHPQPRLAVLIRRMGIDPAVDEIIVGRDRRVEVRRLRGGAGGTIDHYRLTSREMSELRRWLGRLGRRGQTPVAVPDRWYYTLRLGAGTPRYYVDRRVPRRAQPAIRALERLIDASPQRDPNHRSR